MLHRRTWRLPVVAILCANTGWATESADLDVLRKTIQEGDAFFQQGKYQQASERFLAVWSQVKVPTGAWWAGQTYEKLRDWARAAQFYATATLLEPNQFWTDVNTPAQLDAKASSKTRLDAIKPRVPQTLEIEVSGDASSVHAVLLDGIEFPQELTVAALPVAVGAHDVILVGKDGSHLAQRTVDISVKQQAVVTIEIVSPVSTAAAVPPAAPPPAPLMPIVSPANGFVALNTNARDTTKPSKTLRWAAYGSFGIGAAGFVVGATAGIVTLKKYSDLKSKCDGGRVCDPAIYDAEDSSYDSWRTAATAGLFVSGFGAALGATFLWLDSRQERAAAWNLSLGPGAIRVNGSF